MRIRIQGNLDSPWWRVQFLATFTCHSTPHYHFLVTHWACFVVWVVPSGLRRYVKSILNLSWGCKLHSVRQDFKCGVFALGQLKKSRGPLLYGVYRLAFDSLFVCCFFFSSMALKLRFDSHGNEYVHGYGYEFGYDQKNATFSYTRFHMSWYGFVYT